MFVKEIWRYPVKSMAGERMPREEGESSASRAIALSWSMLAAEW
jgi:uncharacterized protein YcbX